MMQRGGPVVINVLDHVKQKTMEPFIKDTIVAGTLIYTDEYSIYARLQSWGYKWLEGQKTAEPLAPREGLPALRALALGPAAARA
jgi:ISXO2 transposase-like protein